VKLKMGVLFILFYKNGCPFYTITPQAVRGVYPQAMLMGCGSGAFDLREGRKLKVAVLFTM